MSDEKEFKAATELARNCIRLEQLGMKINLSNLFLLWDRVHWAIDVKTSPKWVVFFDADKDDRWIKTLHLGTGEGATTQDLQGAVSATLQEFRAQGRRGVKSCTIATREGFYLAIESIKDQFAWARNVYFNQSPEIRDKENVVLNQLKMGTMIDPSELPTEDIARRAAMGELLEFAPSNKKSFSPSNG